MAGNDKVYFSAWDYVVCSVMIVTVFVIGVVPACLSKRRNLPEQFLMGSRRLSVVPVALSMTLSCTVTITVLATPVDVFMYNTMFVWICLAYVLGGILVCRLFVPIYFDLQVVSVYEYVELRFNKTVRIFCTLLFIVQMMLYLGIILYLPSLVLHTVTGFNLWASVGIAWSVAILYTMLGGMTAILWSDVVQFLVILLGIIAAIVMGSNRVGGMDEVWRIARQGERLQLAVVSFDPTVRHTIWSVLLGMTVIILGTSSTNQAIVQRYLSLQSPMKAKIAIMLATVLKVVVTTLCVILGVVVYAAYSLCDPYSSGKISRVDQMTPYFVMDMFHNVPGLPGLFVSAILAASMSSLSSGIHSLSAATGEDILKAFWPNIGKKRYGVVVRVFAFVYGLVIFGFACLAAELQENILPITVSVFGVIGGNLLGIFTLGIFFHRSNSRGTLVGAILSLIVVTWMKLGSASSISPLFVDASTLSTSGCWSKNATTLGTTESALISTEAPRRRLMAGLYRLSYQYYAPMGLILTVALGMIGSGIGGFRDPNTVDQGLKLYIVDSICCCLPICLKDLVRRDGKHVDKHKTDESKCEDEVLEEVQTLTCDEQEPTPKLSEEYQTTTWL